MAILFIDVFFIYNFFINLFLLTSTKLMCFIKTKSINLLTGAFIGAFYSVCRIVFDINGILEFILDFIILACIVIVAFIPKTLRNLLKSSSVFFLANFIYGGAMFFLVYFFNIGIHFGGGLFYIDLPVSLLIISSSAIYLSIYFIKRITERKLLIEKKIYNLEITVGKEIITTTALHDTGNALFEPLSGAPVILIEENLLKDKNINITTYRFVPYRSAGGNGYLSAFLPDAVKINNKKTDILVYVAIFGGILSKDKEYKAILHPFLLTESHEIKEMCRVDI